MVKPPKGKSKKKNQAEESQPATRVVSGKELRNRFVAIKNSDEGFQTSKKDGAGGGFQSLIPACVECEHCRLPVYPASAKVATQATHERLEMSQGKDEESAKKAAAEKALERQKEKEALMGDDDDNLEFIAEMEKMLGTEDKSQAAKPDEEEEANEEEEDEDDDDDSDLDTVEKLERRNEKLEESNEMLEEKNEKLELENERLQTELDETKEKLEEANQKIEFLEASEARWRDKYRTAMDENDQLRHEMDEKEMIKMDCESHLLRMKSENSALHTEMQIRQKRRDALLIRYVIEVWNQNKTEVLGLCMRFWKYRANFTRTRTTNANRERSLREDIYGRAWQVEIARAEIATLEAHVERHIGERMKCARHLLGKFFSVGAPWDLNRPWKAWTTILPMLQLENLYDQLQKDHEIKVEACKVQDKQIQKLEKDLAIQIEKYKNIGQEISNLQFEIANKDKATRAEKAALLKEAQKREDAAVARTKDEAELRYQAAMEGFNQERSKLDDKIEELQSSIDVLTFGGSNSKRGEKRVVPRGKGVLCIGCMRQLVQRDVMELPAKEAYSKPAEYIEELKEKFFDSSFQAALDPSDELMISQWRKKIDPHCVTQPLLRPITREVGQERVSTAQSKRPPSRCESLPALAKKVEALGFDPPMIKASRHKEILDKDPLDKPLGMPGRMPGKVAWPQPWR